MLTLRSGHATLAARPDDRDDASQKGTAMDAGQHEPIPGWQYGVDPLAAGLVVRSIGRVDHQLGEALRLELAPPGDADSVHLQWYIATSVGPWAMWTACRPDEAAAREAVLHEVTWFGTVMAGEPLAEPER
jgi:hypothetical protein